MQANASPNPTISPLVNGAGLTVLPELRERDRTLAQPSTATPKVTAPAPRLNYLQTSPEEARPTSTSAVDLMTAAVSAQVSSPQASPRPQFSGPAIAAPATTSPDREGKDLTLSFAAAEIPLGKALAEATAPSNMEQPLQLLAQDQPEEDESEATEGDPELGVIRIRSTDEDPELGILRIREEPVIPSTAAQPSAPIAYLTGRFSIGSSGNIFLATDPLLGLIGDQFVRPGVALGLYPSLGPETLLISSAEINLQRYFNYGSINYDELRFRLGVRQILSPRSYGQLTWSYQELFRPGLKDRFFENNSVELFLARRDPLTPEIAINSYYQVQFNFSNPNFFDRLVQFAGVYASYQFSPQVQAGITYQLTLADYTGFERFDTYHQLLGQIVYQVTPEVRMTAYGGFSFGRSSLPTVRYEDMVLGVTIEGTVGLF